MATNNNTNVPAVPTTTAQPTFFNDTPQSSVQQSNSRYVQGGTTDVFAFGLGFWDRLNIPPASDDINYKIPPQFDKRPDLVAKAVYNQVTLTWLVLQYNNIVDINTEFLAGTILTLPSQRRAMLSILTQPTGGNPVSTT